MGKQPLTLPPGIKTPDHLAIIPDGNRRWARGRGQHTFYGHLRGFDLMPDLVRASREMGVHTLTLWVFSTENWDRDPEEVAYLMKLFEQMVERSLEDAHEQQARMVHLGRKDRVPDSLLRKIVRSEVETRDYGRHVLNIALDYGGHDELNRAIARLVGGLTTAASSTARNETPLDWQAVVGTYAARYPIFGLAEFLDTAGQPYPLPDLLIRTSGEQRTSGLLNWQTAYTEYYFEPDHFPDFSLEKLRQAILDYSRRRRRFGGSESEARLAFDPEKVGKHEARAWRELRQGRSRQVRQLLLAAYEELYGLNHQAAAGAVDQLLRARENGDRRQWRQAEVELRPFFQAVKAASGLAFDVCCMSELEVDCWRRRAEDQPALEAALVEAMAEQFRLNRLQAGKAARLKLLALLEEDRASAPPDARHHTALNEEYWIRSYRALREMVA
jgi:undecaprenyl diphosphate synthase